MIKFLINKACDYLWQMVVIGLLFPAIGVGFILIPWYHLVVILLFVTPIIFCLWHIIKNLKELRGIKGKLMYNAFGIRSSSIDPDNKLDFGTYFEVVINNLSEFKIFFKLSDKSQLKIDDRTIDLNDGDLEQLFSKIDFILPGQIYHLPFPLIKVPSAKKTMEGYLNLIFNYGEEADKLIYQAEFDIWCEIVKKKTQDKEFLDITDWDIKTANF